MTKLLKLICLILLLALSSCGGLTVKDKTTRTVSSIKDIPLQCKDATNKYKVIKTILSKGAYKLKPQKYQPIQNPKGFISTDFDKNGMNDLIFLERSGQDIRMISCINLQRSITPFKVHETIEADFQTISESIRLKGKHLVLSIDRHEHNWGSDSETSHYRYHNGQFILDQREIISSSGDGMRSDTYEFYDFINKRFKSSSSCGGLEEGCKPRNSVGILVISPVRATLSNGLKGYTRLIKD